jgi:hypothetical protein
MKPIYKMKDIDWTSILTMIATLLIFELILIFALNEIYDYSNDVSQDIIVDTPWFLELPTLLAPIMLGLAFIFRIFELMVSVKAFDDKIVIQIFYVRPFKINRANITAIQPSPLPISRYYPGLKSRWNNIERNGWRVFAISSKNIGLMIQTSQRKYIISRP